MSLYPTKPEPVKTAKQRRQDTILLRRNIARLRRAGITDQRVIAEQLGVSPSTVNRYFLQLNKEYRESAIRDTAVERGRDLDRIEALIASAWPMATRSKNEGGPSWRAMTEINRLMRLRMDLLGLGEVNVTHRYPGGAPTSFTIVPMDISGIMEEIGPPDGIEDASTLVLDRVIDHDE